MTNAYEILSRMFKKVLYLFRELRVIKRVYRVYFLSFVYVRCSFNTNILALSEVEFSCFLFLCMFASYRPLC
jgi:hypothetical protein